MHDNSSFGLGMGQTALLPVLNARFQLKSRRHLGLYGDNTANKRPQSFHTPQNNHQMVSPGQQGGFEVTRAASKGGFHVIHDLGGGAGEGGVGGYFSTSSRHFVGFG